MIKTVVAGIGTGVGKTFIATILAEALEADYWKPVQAGNLDNTDTDFVQQHITNNKTYCHPEVYRLSAPMSPHAAAAKDGIGIDLEKLTVPKTKNHLIIEPPGGLMVPLNQTQLNVDVICQWGLPVILVSKNYLGSINHTLLTARVLKDYAVNVPGIIFNGEPNPATEEIILNYTGLACIARINQEQEINKKTVKTHADQLREKLNVLFS
ncbi:MAG TPA: dethiobiotin synthase [Chitinophagaceae bacterium]|nr:dethiobiotin synthase [Chitinophagaceae bacterium]